MTDCEDEYAIYDDFSNFTEEELAQIDSLALPSTSKSIPHVQVELEGSATETCHSPSKSTSSPMQLFRPSNILSVTDISSLAWCEVQFDYGLRQMRHRRLKDRPASFVTEKGKEIFVDADTAASSDKIKKKGVSIHKKLEREIRPEEIKVKVTTQEESWGLRLINMIDCIDSLLCLGCAREMPVFGLVEGHVVVGIIDEIIFLSSPRQKKKRGFQSSPSTPQKPKRMRRSPSQSPKTSSMSLDKTHGASFSSDAPPSPSNNPNSPSLHLIDTKTRRRNSLPRDEDTLSSRIQLMLYSRMLSNLMSSALDLPSFWQILGLDAATPFSGNFMAQTLLTQETACLHDLAGWWRVAVSRLDGAKIDSSLQLIYRLQPNHQRGFRRHRNGSGETTSAASSREELEIARAVQASLSDVQVPPKAEQQLARALTQRATDPEVGIEEEKSLVEDPELLWAIEQSLLTHLGLDHNGQTSQGVDKQRIDTPQHDSDIIGTTEFEFDQQLLDEYLVDIMKWWNGERNSRGVSLEESGRCFSCEYRIGCEWREQKANEIEHELKNRRKLANA